MESKAIAKFQRVSPRKTRLVAKNVQGKGVEEAVEFRLRGFLPGEELPDLELFRQTERPALEHCREGCTPVGRGEPTNSSQQRERARIGGGKSLQKSMIDLFRAVCRAAVKQFAVRVAAADFPEGSRCFRKPEPEVDVGRLLFKPDCFAIAAARLAEPL